jgi:actin-like ATPase involved in cell morphogenesis
MSARFLAKLLQTEMTVTITPNTVSARSPKYGRSTSVVAPFSCSHQLVADFDILENALKDALKEVSGSPWTFPRLTILIPGRHTHVIERHAIRDAATNAGAFEVLFENVRECAEDEAARAAYVSQKLVSR